MKPFIRRTALVLALIFLSGAGLAWIELLKQGNVLSNPQFKPASAWLTTGLMFLALGLRGWRSRSGRASAQQPDKLTEGRAEKTSQS
jgi:hypothetical protein